MSEQIVDPGQMLNMFALLGQMSNDTTFDKTFKTAFQEEYNKALKEGVDGVEAFRRANKAAKRASMKELPLCLRINVVMGEIKDVDPILIDWKAVNELLFDDLNEFDYQLHPNKVGTVQDIINMKMDIDLALEDLQPWRVSRCKDCGKKFSMNFSEVDYFLTKGLKLPKRCSECREYAKNGETLEEKRARIANNKKIQKDRRIKQDKLDKSLEESKQLREEFKTSSINSALLKAGLK